MESSEIIELRPEKNKVEPTKPYHYLHEREIGQNGALKKVNTIFLTNSECPFKCVMCDLWKNTVDNPVSEGDVPEQIQFALDRLPEASVIKLYNSGNFFDRRAIPPSDYATIADQLSGFERVIIENHPKLCDDGCLQFSEFLDGRLEIAMGLETVHPEVLPKLNKKITKENFLEAAIFLSNHGIDSRAFILLNPPFLTNPQENIEWTLKSVRYAIDCGITACSIIPTRDGNGVMEKLKTEGQYVPPTLKALEESLDRALNIAEGRARVFVDLWDLGRFSSCEKCLPKRKKRLQQMNVRQHILPRIRCHSCENGK